MDSGHIFSSLTKPIASLRAIKVMQTIYAQLGVKKANSNSRAESVTEVSMM
mgnify:CR=1 FL=1